MLKRLELIGFKSFADKTRFDFSPGITGVVGPNGSGKSNVVDAIRWLLGEQSAKSLRGAEMADVIFNGSSSRKSLGMAEATVVFDNAKRLLSVDAEEVQISRRVYRDGTGEYLINGQMARLKDIKDILLGSGAGSNGYTIIAQGRVDELLQASTKDRREIFDEAAGISRFKAKKLEALRKLDSVEQNLTRSKDRLESLDAQLRTLRLQAAKAQRHKEYSDRLKELRVGLGVREYRELSTALEAEERVLAELKAEVEAANTRTHSLESRAKELDWEVSQSEDALRHQEAKLAEARQQIAGYEATIKHERSAAAEHDEEVWRIGRERADLGLRVKSLEAEAARAVAESEEAESRLDAVRQAAESAAAALADSTARTAELDRQAKADRDLQFELVGRAANARSLASSTQAQVERLQKEFTRKLGEISHKASQRETLETALVDLSQADADLQSRLGSARTRLKDLFEHRDSLRESQEKLQHTLEERRVRQGGLQGRIEVLEGLEKTQEGLGAGVREVIEKRLTPQSTLSDIVGLVADLLTVPREIAPLVELALGEAAQRFVVKDPTALDVIASAIGDLTGRVGFIPLSTGRGSGVPAGDGTFNESPEFPPLPAGERSPFRYGSIGTAGEGLHDETPESSNTPRPVGERHSQFANHPLPGGERVADSIQPALRSLASFVECERTELASLPEQLLGNVALVDSLAEARQLAAAFPALRFITKTGELLEPDGTLTIGPPSGEGGLVSRKSELRELREQLETLTREVADAEAQLFHLRREADKLDGVIDAVDAEIGMLSGEAGDLQQQIAKQRSLIEQLDESLELLNTETKYLEDEVRQGEAKWLASKQEADDAEREADAIKSRLESLQAAIAAGEQERDRCQQAHTEAQVTLSRSAAERERLRERQSQIEGELRRRKSEAIDRASTFITARDRALAGLLAMLRASSGMAEAFLEKERRERLSAEHSEKAAASRIVRDTVRDELRQLRDGWQEKQNAAHERELKTHDLRSRRDTTVARIRDDYGLELAELANLSREGEDPAEQEPAAPLADQQEIDDLRKKIARLGSVNMEALEELARVEAEHDALKAQHADLAAARQSLQQVIDTINADSRTLFTETLTAIRGYFQELFRKLFGGGQADIILEDGVDVLESGIEITARPPGKELRTLSLLSGGEKTMTAIALLLAIFRNKPSPFCILDEVDAALDEANTTRFAGVIGEFLDRSQFIVVTHKKRTMAAADRLWGVTMQESGVSRLLPMRFEDWPDEEPAKEAG
ncbi:MAG: AAA family ATPase [Gemmataceae bacterium]